MPTVVNRFSQGFFYTPSASVNPSYDSAIIKPKLPTPLSNGSSDAIHSEIGVCALVRHLLLNSRPSAVTRFIVSVIIDSINRVTRSRAFSHVCQEHSKILPLFAYGYASRSVDFMLWVFGVLASLLHPSPAVICFRGNCAMASSGNSMLEVSSGCFFVSGTSARRGYSAKNRTLSNIFCFSAVANTVPVLFAVSPCYLRNNRPTTKFLTSKVFELCHSTPRMLRTLKGAWQASVRMLFGSYPSHAECVIA